MVDFNSYEELTAAFEDDLNESKALSYLEQVRWNGIIVSPFSQNSKVYHCKSNKYKCRETGKYFNAKTNTIFHNSRISLQKWFAAIWIIVIEKNNITSVALAKELQITQKSAWYMMRRIKTHFDIKKTYKKTLPPSRKKIESIEVLTDPDKLKMSDWLNMLKK